MFSTEINAASYSCFIPGMKLGHVSRRIHDVDYVIIEMSADLDLTDGIAYT